MLKVSEIENNDVLTLFSGKKIIIDDESIKYKDLICLLKQTEKITRKIKNKKEVIYRNKKVVYFDTRKIKDNDVLKLWDNSEIVYKSNEIKQNELLSLLLDVKKIIRGGIWIGRKKNYKHSFEFNQRYEFTRKQRNKKSNVV